MTLKSTIGAGGWVRSSYSSNDGPDCVEVCAAPGAIRVRDSKDPEGPKLAFSEASWSAFTGFASETGRA